MVEIGSEDQHILKEVAGPLNAVFDVPVHNYMPVAPKPARGFCESRNLGA